MTILWALPVSERDLELLSRALAYSETADNDGAVLLADRIQALLDQIRYQREWEPEGKSSA